MNELITRDGLLTLEAQEQLVELERQYKAIGEAKKKLNKAIKAEMEARGIVKIDTPEILISYIQPSYREDFDEKALKNDDEALYNKYIKLTNVSASIRVTVRKNETN